MPDTIDKAVYLEDLERVLNVVGVLEQLYDADMWTGGMLFLDSQGGLLLVACFDPGAYTDRGPTWETVFPPAHLRSVTLEQACTSRSRYRPWLGGDIPNTLRTLRLLPGQSSVQSESVPPLAVVQAERDPRGGLP